MDEASLMRYGRPLMKKSSYNYSCGALQTYFGVYGNRTAELPERNEYWIRPNSNARPKGYEKIEGSASW